MKLLTIGATIIVGAFAFRVAERLSPDTLALALGIVLGLCVACVGGIIVLVTVSHRDRAEERREAQRPQQHQLPPVIIVAGHLPQQSHQQPHYRMIEQQEDWR
jgi:hypothetical protein